MKKEKIFPLIICFAIFAGSTSSSATYAAQEFTINDYKDARAVVEKHCALWKSTNFRAMYSLLSSVLKEKIQLKDFLKDRQKEKNFGASLASFTLSANSSSQKDNIIIKSNLTFKKDFPPEISSGIYKFFLVKEKRAWKIDKIRPPIKPPKL